MRKETLALLLLVGLASAFSTSFNASVTKAADLVRVTGDLDFNNAIPGSDYERLIGAVLSLPQGSLDGIVSDRVVVHVYAESQPENQWVFFRESGSSYKSVSFDLSCEVEGGKCAPNSTLAKTLVVRMHAPLNGSYPHSEAITVTWDLAEKKKGIPAVSYDDFMQAVNGVEEKARAMPAQGDQVLKALSQAREKAESGDYSKALAVVEEAGKKLGGGAGSGSISETASNAINSFTGVVSANRPLALGAIFVLSIAVYLAYERIEKRKRYYR